MPGGTSGISARRYAASAGSLGSGGRNVTLASDGALHLISAAVSGDLHLSSTGLIHNTNAWTVAGETFIDAAGQDVVLTAGHDFEGAVHITARNVFINDVDNLVLGNLVLSGNLTVTAGGALTSTGSVQVAGTTSLTANGISLTQAGNDFVGTVQITSSDDVTLRDANALDLGTSIFAGNLVLTLGGNLSDSGRLSVAGSTSLVATGHDVVLDVSGHDFTGEVSVSADDFTLRHGGALALGTIDLTGNMELQAGGAISASGTVQVDSTSRLDAGTGDITLAQALTSNEKMDWIIQKSVELGVTRIQPVLMERSVVRLSGERAEKRREHWQAVAISACEQCGRNRVPQVSALTDLREAANTLEGSTKLMLSPQGRPLGELPAEPAAYALLVGPEGGFSETEARILGEGWVPVRLGARVLRTETAGLAGIAALQTLHGDWR